MTLRKRKSISVKAAKKNCFEKIVPIPNEFYASNKEEDLIVPKGKAVPMALVLQFMQWGAFAINQKKAEESRNARLSYLLLLQIFFSD